MADSKIPVEIEVRLDERSVGVSMDALKAKVKTQGREIGKSLSGAFSDISFMSDAVMKAEREKDKFLKKQLDADRAFNNSVRGEAKKTSDSQLALIKQQEAAMWASYEVEKSGKKALEDYKVSLAKKAAAEQAAASMFVGPRLPKSFSRDNLMQGVVTGNQDAIRTMAKLHEEGNKMNAVFGKTATLWGHIEGRLRGVALLTTELTRAFFGLSLAVAAVGAPAIFGTRYLKNIEDAKMGLIGTLVTMGKFTEGTDKFQAALGLANDTIKSLEVNALRFGIPLDEILNVFRAITASGLQAGMTLEQIGKSAAIGTVAVRALGLDARQSVQELRDLFMGGIMPASSTLATSLGLRDSDIKKAKADAKAGIKDFYDFIMEQLQGYELVAAERTNTLSGSMDLLGMKLQRLFANEGVFTSIKDAVKGVSNSIAELDKNTNQLKFNPQLMDQLYQYNAIISKVVGWMGSLAEATLNNINHVVAFTSSIALAATTMGKWGILTILVGWLKGIGAAYTAASTRATAYSLAHSAAMTKVVATTKGVQAATLAAVGKTGLIGLAFFALYEAADMMGLLDGIFGRFEQRVDQARQKVKQMTIFEKQERLSVVEQNLKTLGAKSAEGYDPYSLFNDFKQAAKKAAVSKETGKIILEEEYNQLRDWQKAEYGQLESIETLMRVMNAEREGIVEEIQKAMKPASVKVGAGGVGAFMKGSDALLKGSDFEKRREAESKMNSLLLQMQQGAVELDELYKKRINSNDLEKLNDREEQAKEIRSRIQAMADERRKIEESMNKSEKIKVDPSIARAQKDALTTENIFAEKQDTLVREGAKTYIEAYNDKIAKIKEFAEKNGESIKWEERRNEAYKTVSGYLTQHNAQLNKESEQREANTTATLKYGAAVETSGAALLMEQYAREGFLNSGFKELALSNVLAQSRNDLSKIHEKSVKEQIDSQKELDELVAESSLIFLENEKQKSEFKMQETLKRINAEREEAKKSLELNLKLRMNAGPLSPQEYENYLKTKEAIDKSFMDREETTRKIFNQRVKNAELKDAKETVDKIEGTFKEAFMNIAESGTSGWRSMLNKFKSDFKKNIIEYIYKELAKPFVLNVIAQVTGAMGMSGVSQAASSMVGGSSGGGVGSLLNIGSQGASSLYNLAAAPGTASMMLAGNFAMSGVGQALGLSTATAAGYAAPVYASAAEGGALLSAGTGTAAGGLTAAGSALTTAAAAAPYVLAALAIADAVGAFGKRGGPQQGQYGSLGAEGYKSSFTMSGGDALGNQALAEVAYGQAANLLKMAGKDIAGLTIGQGYKLDPEGSAAGLAYRNISLNGRTVTGGTFDGNNGAQWVGGNSDGAGAANYLGKLTNEEIRKLVDAIGDSGLSETIEKLSANFTDLNDAIGKYTVAQSQQKALLSVVMTEDEKKTLQLADAQKVLDSTFASLGMSVPSTAAGFRDLINGLDLTTKAGQDALTKLSDVSGAYLTVANNAVELANKAAEEAKAAQQEQYGWQIKLDIAQGKYTEQQADRLSIWNAAANDSTRAIISQVWALEDQKVALEAQKVATDAATESLKEMQAVAMEGVDNAFGELVSAYESEISAKESLIDKTKDYIRQLKDFSRSLALGELSTLNPLGKYEAAKSAFDVVSQRAMSGDSAAIEQLQGVSEAYLQASREYYASNVQYADDYNKVQSAISKTVNVAEQQVSSMDAQLITMRQQLSSLTQINESTKSVESAITRLQTALLEAVRVGNIGDVSEQAKTASGLIKGGAGELYNPLTDTWSNKGQSAATSQIRDWGTKILNEQGPMALYEATKSVGLSMSSVNVIAGWKAGTAEDWAKANNLPTFANGGFVKPGWAMVGERGPELVNFATQARVYTADQTSRMISGSGDNEVYLQQVIAELQALIRQNGAASQAMIAELQQVKAELEDLRSRTRLRDGTNG